MTENNAAADLVANETLNRVHTLADDPYDRRLMLRDVAVQLLSEAARVEVELLKAWPE